MEKQANNICTLPVTAIGYFDSNDELDKIFANISVKFPNLEYCYICHLPDNDDTKYHWHILIRNNVDSGKLNINSLKKYFKKIWQGQEKSYLFNSEFRQCKSIYSWYKYCLHDIDYLLSKGLTRNVHYRYNDFFTNSKPFLDELSTYKDINNEDDITKLINLINQGLSDFEILKYFKVDICKISYVLKSIKYVRSYLERC